MINGASTLAISDADQAGRLAINILGMAVIGSIEQYCLEHPVTCLVDGAKRPARGRPRTVGRPQGHLSISTATTGAYESRVLQGIWAAAPYLHNGSVPTLAQLLTPAAQRVTSFAVGPDYDQVNIGLAATQPESSYTFQATGCDDLNSGNSNCGHEYGTTLSAANKTALLEYLKTL